MVIHDSGEAKYIRRIKSQPKREFAVAYLHWLKNGGTEPHPQNLSVMAAQAVRTELRRLYYLGN